MNFDEADELLDVAWAIFAVVVLSVAVALLTVLPGWRGE